MASPQLHNTFRQLHRWVGFFLAGIMAIYALSGILLIFRTTDFLQYEYTNEKTLNQHLSPKSLGKELRLRDFKLLSETPKEIIFNYGTYQKATGIATVTKDNYPPAIEKLVDLHKATTKSPLFFLNITFGIGLLFFVISSFLMFIPRVSVYKNGLKIAALGFLFALGMVLIS